MSLGFAHPWVLALMPLALLPWLARASDALPVPTLVLLPEDRLSTLLGALAQMAAAVAIAANVVALAGPYRSEQPVERIGRGAQIVVALDRSASMDQPFYTPVTLSDYYPLGQGPRRESKAAIARRLLQEFVMERGEDDLAVVLFSAFPMRVLDFTRREEAIESAIAASGFGRGLGETDVGRALIAAASLFAERPYSASRVVLLVSDGGAHLDPETREHIRLLFKRHRVALYWIYLRSYGSPGLIADDKAAPGAGDAVPEHFLHEFFRSLETPYHAYETEDPAALKRAIADIARLERFPIRYAEVVPRQDLSASVYGIALVATLVLAGMAVVEVRRWA